MVYFVLEKVGVVTKRQTSSNRRAQNRASAQAEWQAAEMSKFS